MSSGAGTDRGSEFAALRACGVWGVWQPLYRLAERCRGLGFHFLLTGLLLCVASVGYDATVRFAAHRGVTAWDPSCSWDAIIPAIPWTILIYITLYPYLLSPLLVADRTHRGRCEFAVFVQGMLLLLGISFACFLLLPAETHVRAEMEELVEAGGFPTLGLYELLYMVDRPWNAWPSLHVSESLLLTLHIQRCLQARATRGRFTKACLAAIWTGWVLLSLSVLTTRQHFVWDLISGAGLGALLWVVYVRPRCRRWGLRVNSSGRD